MNESGLVFTCDNDFTLILILHSILAASAETSRKSAQLHNDLICLFEKELVLEILYVISQEMEARENAQYNLLMMELLSHLLRNQDPTAVARSTFAPQKKPPPAASKSNTTVQPRSKPAPKPGSLSAQLAREKQKLRPPTTSRHSHFGGTLVVNRLDGTRQYMSAALVETGTTTHPSAQKRKNKKTDPFIGSGKTLVCHSRFNDEGPTKAQRSLHSFCSRFVKDCYGPLMKSLKNEFRRDSVRLEEGDKVVFFRLVWFFSQWWRVAGRKSQETNSLGQLIFTMDVFTFNLVLNATDTFQQHKKHLPLAQSVALYSEMMQLLLVMYQSKDSTENLMALGLLDRLFYGSDPLDRLPKLLSKWTAGTLTREYACDLIELVHVTLKLLEANASSGSGAPVDKKEAKKDAVARMKQTAAEFDLMSYIVRKIISNQVVFMYTHVLSQYQTNALHVNHHIVALFMRIIKLHVVVPDEEEDRGDMPKNPLAVQPATLEPMLYNIQLFIVLDQVLNDATIRKEKDYSSLIAFSASLMGRFAKHTQHNQLAFVEALFRHSVPHRFCELTTNLYVNEELRMLAERELLMEEHRRLAEAEGEEEDDADQTLFRRSSSRPSARSGTQSSPTQDDDDDDEVEWADEEDTVKKAKKPSSVAKADADSDSEKEQDDDSLMAEKEDGVSNNKTDDDESTVEKEAADDTKASEDGPPSPNASGMQTAGNTSDVEMGASAVDANKDANDNSKGNDTDTDNEGHASKRKHLSDIDGNVGSPNTLPEKKKARIEKKNVGDDDSSDDEVDFGLDTQPPPGALVAQDETKKRGGGFLLDDDEDDDE